MEPQKNRPADDAPAPNPHAKSFTDVIREVDRGKVLPEIEDLMQKVVRAVKTTGKKGKLKVVLDFKLTGDAQLLITCEPDATIPKPNANPTLYFADDENRLMRRDPRQYELDMRPAIPKPIREDRPPQP